MRARRQFGQENGGAQPSGTAINSASAEVTSVP